MSRRLVLCEGPDDLNALRAIAQHQKWGTSLRGTGAGAGQERETTLQVDGNTVRIVVPRKGTGGEGKEALAGLCARELQALPPQVDPSDPSHLTLLGVVFDPDDKGASDFHTEIEREIAKTATAWTLARTGNGVWKVERDPGEVVEVRAVHWRSPGGVLDGLPDHSNLERLLCAVAAKAYPDDHPHVEGWLTEINQRRKDAGRHPARWKAAIHVWLASVYDKVDELNAANRFLCQDHPCKAHIDSVLTKVGLLEDLRHLIGPA